jgi:hypothetical protein
MRVWNFAIHIVNKDIKQKGVQESTPESTENGEGNFPNMLTRTHLKDK